MGDSLDDIDREKERIEERLKRYASYRNPSPHCTYPYETSPLGYCWAYANHVDGHPKFENIMNYCSSCEFYKTCHKEL